MGDLEGVFDIFEEEDRDYYEVKFHMLSLILLKDIIEGLRSQGRIEVIGEFLAEHLISFSRVFFIEDIGIVGNLELINEELSKSLFSWVMSPIHKFGIDLGEGEGRCCHIVLGV